MIRSIFYIIFLRLIWVFPLKAQGQLDSTMSLQACLNYALTHNFDIRQIDIEKRERAFRVAEGKLQTRPDVQFTAQYLHYFNQQDYFFPDAEGNVLSQGESSGPYPVALGQPFNFSSAIEVEQKVYDKRWKVGKAFGDQQELLTPLLQEKTEADVIYSVALVYLEILGLQEKKQVLFAQQYRLQALLPIIRLQFNNNLVKKTDVQSVEIQLNNLDTKLTQLQNGINTKLDYLKFLLGMPIDQGIILVDSIAGFSAEEMATAMVVPTSINQDLLQQQQQLKLAEGDLVDATYAPSLGAFAQIQLQGQSDNFNFFDKDPEWNIVPFLGIRLEVPLLNGAEKKLKHRQLELEASKIELNLDRVKAQELLAFRQAVQKLQEQQKVVQFQQQNLELANEIYTQLNQSYQEGVTLLSDVLEAEANWKEADSLYKSALIDYQIAGLNGLKAMGKLSTLLEK